MDANPRTPAEIFGHSVRYVVPLFQRPYVWTREAQWEPLWEDVRAVAERVLNAPSVAFGPAAVSPHFLGAVVLDQQSTPTGFISVRHVIDGQQRLTTLQLLLDAAQEVVAERGAPEDAAGLQSLVLNNPALAHQPEERFKVWPTDRDQHAFRAAMDDGSTPTDEHATTSIVRAHMYFRSVTQEWAQADGAAATYQRLHALTQALAQHLKLVVIDLEPGDNAQVIFETLNHRGSPLLAADLVKNLVFQAAQHQGLDVHGLYRDHWRQFDEDYWRAPQRQGRRVIPRIDLFLHHWLTMRLLREVPTDRVFTDFRDEVASRSEDIASLLAEIAHDARVYASFERFSPQSAPGQFHYRVIGALDSAVVSPFLLWLLRHPGHELPIDQRDRALRAVESWLVRRALVGATSKDLNNVVLSLLKALGDAPVESIGDATVAFLEAQRATSRVWPSDRTVRTTFLDLPIYRVLTRARLRMLLEALEDSLRGPLGEGQLCPRNLTIEHVLPQAWNEHWGQDLSDDPSTVETRDLRVHTLGNLTLVNGRLNPTLSNRPWRDDQAEARGLGSKGKRSYLLEHAQLKLSARVAAHHDEAWNDALIEARTSELVERLLVIWPGPAIHDDDVPEAKLVRDDDRTSLRTDSTDSEGEGDEMASLDGAGTDGPNPPGTYRALGGWLAEQPVDVVSLSFEQVEDVIGAALPPSARVHEQHWRRYGGSALARGVVDAGWQTAAVDLAQERVVFRREADVPPEVDRVGRGTSGRGKPSRFVDLISDGVLAPGDALFGSYLGRRFTVTVGADGSLDAEGRSYPSPSMAATALTGQGAVNGWRFWRTFDGTPIADLRGLQP